jgi:hypothetical protein
MVGGWDRDGDGVGCAQPGVAVPLSGGTARLDMRQSIKPAVFPVWREVVN